ncbi:response regulator transcription factor [Streptomyces sp. NPDC017529]|uniref:response regulator transcription factor n=1 Tax=Streptomyces sp. NPDC017529 TaxID=3365000 RepID=UPI0037B0BFAA
MRVLLHEAADDGGDRSGTLHTQRVLTGPGGGHCRRDHTSRHPGHPAGAAGPHRHPEIDVLKLIAAGFGNREISRHLFISEPTVKTHVNRIFAKTGSKDRAQASEYARKYRYAD